MDDYNIKLLEKKVQSEHYLSFCLLSSFFKVFDFEYLIAFNDEYNFANVYSSVKSNEY